jgi:asparagine synthase (glutamine-hydrolysing)
MDEDEFESALFALPDIFGQPFADSSAIPSYAIAQRVAADFPAVFSGDGPDFFYGSRDFRVWYHYYRIVPRLLRSPLSRLAEYMDRRFALGWSTPNRHVAELLWQPQCFWIFHKKFKSAELERLMRQPIAPDRFWGHRFLESRRDIPLYERLRLTFHIAFGVNGVQRKGCDIHDALLVDFICPYCDPDLFEFVQFLPTRLKLNRYGQAGKYLHRKLIKRYIPPEITARRKRGFLFDFADLGPEPLRKLTERYLSRKRLGESDLFDAGYAAQCVRDYFSGDLRMGPLLWTLLVFEIWRERSGS